MKQHLAVAPLIIWLILAPVSHAQSVGDDSAVAEQVPVEAAPSATTSEAPAAAAPLSVSSYLRTADGMPARFATWETDLNETLRLYRLGAMTQTDAANRVAMLASAARITAERLGQITPPSQFAHSNDLNIAASNEYAAAFDLGLAYLQGDANARGPANDHFAQAQVFASQAAGELR